MPIGVRFTIDDVKNKLNNYGFKLIDEFFKHGRTPINFIDNDGYKYRLTFNNFNASVDFGSKPMKFGPSNPYTFENMITFLGISNCKLKLFPNQKYKNNKSKFKLYDSEGYLYELSYMAIMTDIKYGNGFSIVDKLNPYSIHNIQNFIEINNMPFHIVPDQSYEYSYKKLKFKCHNCPDDEIPFEIAWDNIKQGIGCSVCCNRQIGKYNNFAYHYPKESLEWDYSKNSITPDKISPKTATKYYWICSDCGGSYYQSPGKIIIDGLTCKCRIVVSKGEKLIGEYLQKYENAGVLNFIPQYRMLDCFDKKPLPFDFAVWKDGTMFLIEYQGEQHYRSTDVFGGYIAFVDRKRKDKIKYDFCATNSIEFIVVHYYQKEYMIEILNNKLNLQ